MRKLTARSKLRLSLFVAFIVTIAFTNLTVFASQEADIERQTELFLEFTEPLSRRTRSGEPQVTLRAVPVPELGQDKFVIGFEDIEGNNKELVEGFVENLMLHTGIERDMVLVVGFTVCPEWVELWNRPRHSPYDTFYNADETLADEDLFEEILHDEALYNVSSMNKKRSSNFQSIRTFSHK
ncbi:MAG: hypothetical protein FWD96_07055, partial [Defluviitaleaceae bacterium]|nr:hypothetical protein [Defluviitaleaceae bacterium]